MSNLAPPQVAIVGRPNVGKSSLLNRLARRRVAIVEPTAGVTRDRVSTLIEWAGRKLQVTDTGGLGMVDEELLKSHIEQQIQV
ncbi:MAG: GTPase, partial [Planctomycetota bacterium]